MTSGVTRTELHRRMMLLRDQIAKGKLQVAEHLSESLQRDLSSVMVGHDGLVIPETVSSRVRAMASGIAHLEYRSEVKDNISCQEIQEAYFSLVGSLFDEVFGLYRQTKSTSQHFARWFSSIEDHVETNDPIFLEFLDRIETFWEDLGDAAWIVSEDEDATRAIFGGEPFPNTNPTSGLGLYFDTVVLPDPFLRTAHILRIETPRKRVRRIMRWALDVLELRPLALASIKPPLLLILPDRFHFQDTHQSMIEATAEDDTLHHLSLVTARSFESVEDAMEFLHSVREPAQVMNIVADPSRICFDVEWDDPLERQLQHYYEKWVKPYGPDLSLGQSLVVHVQSRIMQATDLVVRSRDLGGSPVIHAPTSWKWFQWTLEYRSRLHPSADVGPLHMARSLGNPTESSLVWAGNIPPDALIEMRQQDVFSELRQHLGKGIEELTSAEPEDFETTSILVAKNLREAIAAHRDKVKALRKKKLRFAGKDLSSFLVSGTIGITAAATGTPLLGVLAVLGGTSGVVPTLRDLKRKYDELKIDKRYLEHSPMGILASYAPLPKD